MYAPAFSPHHPPPCQVLHLCLVHTNMNVRTALMERNAYLDIKELYEPMKIMYDSLLATGDDSVSAGGGGGGRAPHKSPPLGEDCNSP